jgi:hypothetical protein
MTIQNVLESVFPSGILRQLVSEEGGAFALTGLPNNSHPQNCTILARGQDAAAPARREFFLARAQDGTMLFFSLCTESEDAEAFVTGHGFAAPEDATAVRELDAYARWRIEVFSGTPSSVH